jgi:hypothetical protein
VGGRGGVDVLKWVQKNPNIIFLGSLGVNKVEKKNQIVLTTLVQAS